MEHTRHGFRAPKESDFASFAAINLDLHRVGRLATRYIDHPPPRLGATTWEGAEGNRYVEDILFHADLGMMAVLAYCRIFARGRIPRLPDSFNSYVHDLPEDFKTTHAAFISLRNRYLAHPTGEFEQRELVLVVSRETGTPKVCDVEPHQSQLGALGSMAIGSLRTLAERLCGWVRIQMKLEKEKLIDYAKQQPIGELMSIAVVEPKAFPLSVPELQRASP